MITWEQCKKPCREAQTQNVRRPWGYREYRSMPLQRICQLSAGARPCPTPQPVFIHSRSCPNGALSPHLKIVVSIPQSASTARGQEARGSTLACCISTVLARQNISDIYGRLSSPAHDIYESVSNAARIAKQFQSPDGLQKFLPGLSRQGMTAIGVRNMRFRTQIKAATILVTAKNNKGNGSTGNDTSTSAELRQMLDSTRRILYDISLKHAEETGEISSASIARLSPGIAQGVYELRGLASACKGGGADIPA